MSADLASRGTRSRSALTSAPRTQGRSQQMAIAPEQAGIGIRRYFTTEGVDPYDEITWERRDARITNFQDGTVAFEQLGVEFPSTWSLNATNIVAQKYFRGTPGTPERESSLRQVIDRVADTITQWGLEGGYFVDVEEARVYNEELRHLLVTQKAAFNSPVWFNIGVPGVPQQASACFILSVDDQMDSILNWYVEEGTIFKGGSGSGINLSRIRSSVELLKGGGTASGPVSFMRGADASAGTIKSGGKTRRAAKMVILNVDHPDIEEFIWVKAREEKKIRVLEEAGFDMSLDGKDMASVQYQNANNSVRVTDEFMQAVVDDADWHLRAVTDGSVVRTVRARDLMRQFAQASWECADPGMQFDTTINRWHTAANTGRINGSNPCSEYMHLDDSACNLASLNLLEFLDLSDEAVAGAGTTDSFDVEGFRHAVEIMFTGQEILVGRADYPTAAIGETSRQFRQLGLGYANLGAMLMALGLPYDSDAGRAYAAAITSLMTGHAYATSARTAGRMGPFAGFEPNREHMLRVLRQHQEAAAGIDEELVPAHLLAAAQTCWDDANELAEHAGVRNSQASVLAPTGTIGLMMDCDTTGIEPDLGLCKVKKLVGGGTMQIVNQTVPRALARLGYTAAQADEIVAYIDEHKSILGAPHLAPEHVPVFACSMGDNTIHYSGHVRMMAAVQPFISGAISKTVNMPEDATVEEVEQLHVDAWRLGVKAIAIYRDNCKVAQPLSTAKSATQEAALAGAAQATQVVEKIVERVVEKVIKVPTREKLPRHRNSHTFEFRVADCKGFVTVGEFDDGRPGEIFLRISKQGSTLAGIMDAFAISVSYGLQYGVPLRVYVETLTNTRFEPAGMTDDPDLRIASSILDYIFRRLAVDYLSVEERAELNILTTGERTQPTLPGVEETITENRQGSDIAADPPSFDASSPLLSATDAPRELSLLERAGVTDPAPAKPNPNIAPPKVIHADAPYCMQCGVQMQRAGSCHACPSCGSTSGCS
ncbi:MAG: vitamin B12-dependent ribonucleotide reductase [Acidimicrobiales bacterium]|nr:vitamin B12-dependent ribonucleotide reductase [Acidimicrobiales bacterium]